MPKPLKANVKPRPDNDLFGTPELKGRAPAKAAPRGSSAEAGYTAADIEVLEGLEPVRRRPGMYIGGTDEKALHHLFAEVIDNSMDEALAGHATFIEVELGADGFLTITDNGRGIPVDPHPKFPKKSALEVIMCTLHSGGKFDSKVYETSGGLHGAAVMLSVFVREPEFQGQTKDRLATAEAQRIVEQAIKDPFDHWLSGNPLQANKLLDFVIERADERLRRRAEKEISRKTAVKKLRLPGKLADCTNTAAEGSELFIVEGDSAGGTAKHARNRQTQAILPLRGKILNVASAGKDKLTANAQLADLMQAIGCGTLAHYREEDLRYSRIIIMTDADVDGAHIASLLITFFYRQTPRLIDEGHLYLAVPPLYRLTHGSKTVYARDDVHKDALLKSEFNANAKVDVGRFKGLGEMMPAQLKETTMDPAKRSLLRVVLLADDREGTADSVERLMGTRAEARFAFISDKAEFASEDLLDV